ncbi:MAG: LysM peptidoglycan-binding domain-containing protein [Planctomycetes bacterium]|nr:LysM peptidoglycan-binding domain-containing protein [Planctomycetota bacterium]
MRTEVKVGLLICVVAVVVVAAWVMIFNNNDEAGSEPAVTTPPPPKLPTRTPPPSSPLVRDERMTLPPLPGTTVSTRPALPVPTTGPAEATANRPMPALELPPMHSVTPNPAAGGTPSALAADGPALRLAAASAPAQQARTYVVRQGDNGFWDIASRPEVYGNGKYWYLIERANLKVDSRRLQPGQKLVIPPLPAETSTAGSTVRPAAAAVAGTTYTIVPNDTLAAIARARYGNEALWTAIVKANSGLDPKRLRVGAKITLPSEADARRLAGVREPASGASTARTASTGYVPGKPWFE